MPMPRSGAVESEPFAQFDDLQRRFVPVGRIVLFEQGR
jgi:hypothetical protein